MAALITHLLRECSSPSPSAEFHFGRYVPFHTANDARSRCNTKAMLMFRACSQDSHTKKGKD